MKLRGILSNVVCVALLLTTFTRGQQTESWNVSTTPDDNNSTVSDDRIFIRMIFDKYGEGDKITFEGFEHLMESLGLGNIDIRDHDLKSHKADRVFRNIHDTHEHDKDRPSTAETRGSTPPSLDQPKSTKQQRTERNPESTHAHGGHDHSSHGDHDHHGHSHDADSGHDDHIHSHPDENEESFSHDPPIEGDKDLEDVIYKPHNILNISGNILDGISQFLPKGVPGCMSPKQMLGMVALNQNAGLDARNFLRICPIIIWELEQQLCINNSPMLNSEDGHNHENDEGGSSLTMYHWIYATLAVLLISMCGLFSVAVIPIMQKWFYHTLLQLLVGLAVGTLSGDAMLHLLPHALLPEKAEHDHGEGEHAELEAMWRGLTALGGIYFFFMAERLLGALTAYRKQQKAKLPLPHQSNSMLHSHEIDEPNGEVGEKLSHYRKNSYGVKVGSDGKEAMQMLQMSEEIPTTRRDSRHSSIHEVGFHGRSSFSADPHAESFYHTSPRGSNADNYVVTVTEHHGHGHGHSHEVPQSVSAVAWMVIMGDGLHNFCDGMAIGAAFASGIHGGISTTVAVFCHELPHELGDFAMLLKTGMKVKQALFYNVLSSVLCFLGLYIGLPLGQVHSAQTWIFAVTAGMFMYIALVDMLPELSMPNEDPRSTPTYTLAVQLLGISIGVSIMLLIAYYEHAIKKLAS